jgi:hypothetical protein
LAGGGWFVRVGIAVGIGVAILARWWWVVGGWKRGFPVVVIVGSSCVVFILVIPFVREDDAVLV